MGCNDYSSSVGEGLFYDCPLESIYLGRNLSYGNYGYSPFYNKKELTSVSIGNRVTSITNNIFSGCSSLTSITIPNSVTIIGRYAFHNCSSLTGSIVIPNSVNSIEEGAFYKCSNILSLTIGTGVLSIGKNQTQPKKVFWLTNTPPEGYNFIGGENCYIPNDKYSFWGVQMNLHLYPYLSSMFEVDGVKYIPTNLSERTCDVVDCIYDSITSRVEINPTIMYKGIEMSVETVMPYAFYKNIHIKELTVSNLGDAGANAFYGCENIEKLTVSNLGDVGVSAFAGCSNMATVTISNQGNINEHAFSNCTNLKTASVSNKGNIEAEAFSGCVNLDQIEISNKGYIGTRAFSGCTSLKSANINNVYTIYIAGSSLNFNGLGANDSCVSESYSFKTEEGAVLSFNWAANDGRIEIYLNGKCILYKEDPRNNYGSLSGTYTESIPPGEYILEAKLFASNGSVGVSDFTIDYSDGMNIGAVRGEAFYACTALTTVTLGDSVSALADKVFSQCVNLKEITIPNFVKSVGKKCFSGCTALKNVIIGDGVATIPEFMFENCIALADVKIGDGVTAIDNYAFTGCSALTNVKLGNSVSTINNYAFQNCSSLPEITIPRAVSKVDNYAFVGCCKLANIVISDRTTALALGCNGTASLFVDCPLDSVYIGGKITYNTSKDCGYSPFYRNKSLRTVVITDKEEQIYDNEFYGCTNLKNIIIGDGVKFIGDYAFHNCI